MSLKLSELKCAVFMTYKTCFHFVSIASVYKILHKYVLLFSQDVQNALLIFSLMFSVLRDTTKTYNGVAGIFYLVKGREFRKF